MKKYLITFIIYGKVNQNKDISFYIPDLQNFKVGEVVHLI